MIGNILPAEAETACYAKAAEQKQAAWPPPRFPAQFNLIVVERRQHNIALLNIHRLAETLGVTPAALMPPSGSR